MTTIIIDAGHGPNTAGKRTPDGKLKEFMFNSAVAQYVKNYLEKENINVLFSHDPSRDVPLKTRTDFANRLNVRAFISIHANAFGSSWNAANGIETFVYPTAKSSSKRLASFIQQCLIQATNRRDRGVKTANFHVLRETNMPAVLVECGFMTNRQEALLLQDANYQKKCALAIASAISHWLRFYSS